MAKTAYTLFIIVAIIITAQTAKAQVVKYGNDFLNIGTCGREQSLGGCAVASTSGAAAGYWNPANLSVPKGYKTDICATHSFFFGGLAQYDFAAASYQADSLTSVGLSFLRLGVDDIQNTIYLFDQNGEPDFSRITYFSTADYALFFSVGRRLRFLPDFSVGGNVKLIYRMEGSFARAYGFGIDLAASYKKRDFSAGIILRDATTTFDVWNINKEKFDSTYLATGNSIPENSVEQTAPSILWSAAYTLHLGKFAFMGEIGSEITFDGKRNYLIRSDFACVNPCAGLEVSFMDMAFVRFGISDFMKNNHLYISRTYSYVPSLGAGIKVSRFSFDYAFMDASTNSYEYRTNVFTLGARF